MLLCLRPDKRLPFNSIKTFSLRSSTCLFPSSRDHVIANTRTRSQTRSCAMSPTLQISLHFYSGTESSTTDKYSDSIDYLDKPLGSSIQFSSVKFAHVRLRNLLLEHCKKRTEWASACTQWHYNTVVFVWCQFRRTCGSKLKLCFWLDLILFGNLFLNIV